MLAASALLSFGAAAAQLYLFYERDRARSYQELNLVDTSFRDGLERALWQFNFDQVEVLLDGIFAQHDIVFLELTTPGNRQWARGHQDDKNLILRNYSLIHSGSEGHPETVGVLVVGLTLEFVNARLWEQFWALVLSNFIKTILASIAMLVIFDRLAARHLRAISSHARADWIETTSHIQLDRSDRPDELSDIVVALNQARDGARTAHRELSNRLGDLATAHQRLVDANREQAEFTYAISHDLKSPTNTVRMLIRELSDLPDTETAEERADILADLTVTSDRMAQLVEDVLAYSRSVGEEMQIETVDISLQIEDILRDLSSDITEAQADIRVGPLPVVRGNTMQLRLLLQNLISNAVKFRSPDRRAVIAIEQVTAQERYPVKIRIRDNGIGIEPEFHEKIFGLFARLHTHSRYSGSGIGLTICQRIVANHGGRITVTSEKGVGSAFTIVLPDVDHAE